jgi:hypothetical protein
MDGKRLWRNTSWNESGNCWTVSCNVEHAHVSRFFCKGQRNINSKACAVMV